MRTALVLVLLALLAGTASAQEPVAKSKIVSVGIFKNGLTIVKREVQVPQAGSFRLDAAPQPVHGTFWVESNCKVEAAVKMREFDVPFHAGAHRGLQEQLAGKKVTIRLKDVENPVVGVMAKIASPKERREEGDLRESPPATAAPTAEFLILKTAKGHTYVSAADITSLDVDGKEETVKQRRAALVLTVEKGEQKPVVFVSYLTQGLGWAPSYLVDISDPKKLSIEMAAAIRNELADLDEAEVKLISGFPSIQFANVPSPLSPRTTWDTFMAALSGQRTDGTGDPLTQQAIVSNTYFSNARRDTATFRDLGATPAGEGVDMHFEPIGKRSLLDGETLSLTVAKAKVDYERIVEWTVGNQGKTNDGEASNEDIWDVLHFRNPFTFPMTTAAAMVTEKGQFNGQRTCYWANAGEETSLRITRSLSVRVRSQEQEEKAKKPVVVDEELIKIGSTYYRKVIVQGELTVNNHRKQPIKMMIRRPLTGTVLSTEGDPKTHPRENLHAVNPLQDLIWTLNLAAGEEKTLRYRYSTLVVR